MKMTTKNERVYDGDAGDISQEQINSFVDDLNSEDIISYKSAALIVSRGLGIEYNVALKAVRIAYAELDIE
jgi:hypothetical protein